MKAFGSHPGQHVENLSDADVKKDVREDSVPVQRQAYAVLPSTPARLTVTLHDFVFKFQWLHFLLFLKKINSVMVVYR